MTPRFVVCLLGSALLGAGAAALVVVNGFGLLLGLLAYGLVASCALVTATAVVLPGQSSPSRPALLSAPVRSTQAKASVLA